MIDDGAEMRDIALCHLIAIINRAKAMGFKLAPDRLYGLARCLHLKQRLHGIKPGG